MPRRGGNKTKRNMGIIIGGSAPGSTVNYGGASNYALNTVGSGDQQYNAVFSQAQSSGSGWENSSNAIRGTAGQIGGKKSKKCWKGGKCGMKGGKSKRSRGRKHSKRGGNISYIMNQALAPLGILGLQQMYGRRRNKTSKR